MIKVSAYDEVIHEIYEAALVPARWESALTRMIGNFAPRDWEVAFLLWERHDPPAGRFLGTAGVNPMAHDVYLNSFAGNNEWSRRSRRMKVGDTVHTDALISRERFFETSLYNDFLKHWGYGVAIIGMLDRHGPDQLGIVLPGPLAREPGDLKEAVALLLPHFRRSARISRRLAEADLRASTATSLLDTSPYAVFALAPGMQMLLANRAGEDVLASADMLRLQGPKLTVPDQAAQAELMAMSQGKGRERTFSVSLSDEKGRQHIFTALSISEALGDQFDRRVGGASLMLIGGQRVGISGELVTQLEQAFGLTAAEARLASHIYEGSGLEGYAKDRAVSVNAARYLLRGIYEKTGVNTHIALAALLRESPIGWSNSGLAKSAAPSLIG